jgi:hypothetical protein
VTNFFDYTVGCGLFSKDWLFAAAIIQVKEKFYTWARSDFNEFLLLLLIKKYHVLNNTENSACFLINFVFFSVFWLSHILDF